MKRLKTLAKVTNKFIITNLHISFFLLECQNILSGLLEINPSNRLNTQQLLAHPWLNIDLNTEKKTSKQHQVNLILF